MKTPKPDTKTTSVRDGHKHSQTKPTHLPAHYGYARVSTKDQKEDRQLLALMENGVPENNIFVDKQSGKDFDRPSYKRLIKILKAGDVLFVQSIDRLGRNYAEIIEEWRHITKELGAAVVVLDMPLLDTRVKERDLTGTLIADIVLQLLSYVAETERAHNRQRQAEGIAVAKAKGVRFGRPPRERPKELLKLAALWQNGEVTARQAAQKLDVTHRTFIKWATEPQTQEAEEQENTSARNCATLASAITAG